MISVDINLVRTLRHGGRITIKGSFLFFLLFLNLILVTELVQVFFKSQSNKLAGTVLGGTSGQ